MTISRQTKDLANLISILHRDHGAAVLARDEEPLFKRLVAKFEVDQQGRWNEEALLQAVREELAARLC